MMVHNKWTKLILAFVAIFPKIVFGANGQFRFSENSVQGRQIFLQVREIANFATKKIFIEL